MSRVPIRASDCLGQLLTQEARGVTRRQPGEGTQLEAGVRGVRRDLTDYSLARKRSRQISVVMCKMLQNMKVENICDFSIRR